MRCSKEALPAHGIDRDVHCIRLKKSAEEDISCCITFILSHFDLIQPDYWYRFVSRLFIIVSSYSESKVLNDSILSMGLTDDGPSVLD